MFADYKNVVISNYREKKTKGLLSSNLSDPTPGKLRDESLLLLNSRLQVKDEKIIKDFFNSGVASDNYYRSIRRFDVDKLRPLDKFLKGGIEDTRDKNIELLAWLIDFEPRPYDFTKDYTVKEDGGETNKGKGDTEGQPPTEDKPLAKYVIGILTLLVIFGSGSFLSISNAKYENNTKAYICTSRAAKRYHLDSTCHGLNNCKSEIIQMTIAEAKEANKTLCKIEH